MRTVCRSTSPSLYTSIQASNNPTLFVVVHARALYKALLIYPLHARPLWHTVYRVGTTVHLASYTVRRKGLCGPPLTNGTYGQTGGRSHPTDGRFSGASALLNGDG